MDIPLLYKIVSILVAFSMSGCATILISTAPVTETVTKRILVFDDEIVAIGRPGDKDADTVNQGLIIVGVKKAYLLSDGAEDINNILKSLNNKSLSTYRDKDIELTIDKDRFQGLITITYTNNDGQYTQEEEGQLKLLKFYKTYTDDLFGQKKYFFKKNIEIQGTIYAKPDNSEVIQAHFSRPRNVKFFTTSASSEIDTKQVLSKLSALPVTIMFDAITLPFQVLFLSTIPLQRSNQPVVHSTIPLGAEQ